MARRQRNASSTRVLPGTSEHEANRDAYRQVIKARERHCDDCIEQLVDAALLYQAEQEHSDKADGGLAVAAQASAP